METPVKIEPLIDGNIYIGVVHTFHGGFWTPVCGDQHWDNTDAQVICRQMFLTEDTAASALNRTMETAIDRHLKGVACGGWEYELTDCAHEGWGECFTEFEAGVSCSPPRKFYRWGIIVLSVFPDQECDAICDIRYGNYT